MSLDEHRENGYYWVRRSTDDFDAWEPALWSDGLWSLVGKEENCFTYELAEIGERCTRTLE